MATNYWSFDEYNQGEQWDYNQEFNLLDEQALRYGPLAQRPSAANVPDGRLWVDPKGNITKSSAGSWVEPSQEDIHVDNGVIVGDTLETGESLTIGTNESMVVGGSYTINGDASINGDLVTVTNQYSHDQLKNVDPTDHLEVVKEVQITAATGANPAFDGTLTNVFGEQLTAFDVTIAPTNGMADTYGFNVDTGRRWQNGSWDLPLTVNWDEDPGSDLGLTVRIHRRT